jgi:hypothetical protein
MFIMSHPGMGCKKCPILGWDVNNVPSWDGMYWDVPSVNGIFSWDGKIR